MPFTVCLELTTKKTYYVDNTLLENEIVQRGQFNLYEVKDEKHVFVDPAQYLALRDEVMAEIHAIDRQHAFYEGERNLIMGWLANPSTIDTTRFPAGVIPDNIVNLILFRIMDYREHLNDNRFSLQIIHEYIGLAKQILPQS